MSDETKYSIPDDHWDEEPETGSQQPDVRVGTHFLEIHDERPAAERMGYNGLVWHPLIEDGRITAVNVDDYCPGPGHTDPMGLRAWDDVPPSVRKTILDALGAEKATDVVDIKATEEAAER